MNVAVPPFHHTPSRHTHRTSPFSLICVLCLFICRQISKNYALNDLKSSFFTGWSTRICHGIIFSVWISQFQHLLSYFISFCDPPAQTPAQVALLLTSIEHTHTHGRTPLYEWSARRRYRHLHNTQQTQRTNMRTLNGIWIRDSSRRAATNLCLKVIASAVLQVVKEIVWSLWTPIFNTWRRKAGTRTRPCPDNSHFTNSETPLLYRSILWSCVRLVVY
jgi:hypothetical protein